jgi:hypothetical protein
MAGTDRSPYYRKAHTPGQSSSTSQNKVISNEAKETQTEVLREIGDVIQAPINFAAFLASNWQFVFIGVAALYLLIRD